MIDELISYIPESSYSDKKMLKLYSGLAKNGIIISNSDIEATTTPDQSPLIVKSETPGNKNHKVVVTRLRDDDGVYKVQSAHVIPFNKKGSVSPLTLSSVDIEDSFVSTGYDRFARFGEKQSCDTFVDCIDDLTGIFPSSFLNILPRGSVMRAYDGYSYRSLCYYIDTFLESSPGVYFGSENNAGGLLGFPLDGKTSFQLVKQGIDAVFSISEGTRITSGLYRNDKSGLLKKSASATDWESDASLDLITKWNNHLESIESDPSGNDGFEIEIHDGKKGWCSFWLDLAGLEHVEQNHVVENFEIYAVGNDPSVIDPGHWTKWITGASTFTVQVVGGSQMGDMFAPLGGWDIQTLYTFDNSSPTIFPFTIEFKAGVSTVDLVIRSIFIYGVGGTTSSLIRFFSTMDLGHSLQASLGYVAGTIYNFKVVILNQSYFDIYINGVLFNFSGVHYTINPAFVFPITGLYMSAISAANNQHLYMDVIAPSWIISSGQTSWLELSETRDFLPDATANIYFHNDEIYNEGNTLYRNINFKKLHRVTLSWDYTVASPWNTFRLDDLDPKEFTWDDGGSALVNGFAINAIRIAANYVPVRVHGFCQSGDYFPFVHAESNKQNYLPFNLDLLEKVTGILGPNRRDTEGFKNLRATQPITVDMSCYTIGNIAGQGSWVANAGDDRNGTTEIHDIVECGDTDAFFALKGLQPYGYEGFNTYIDGSKIRDVNGWNAWVEHALCTFVKDSGKARLVKTGDTGGAITKTMTFSTPCSAAGWYEFKLSLNSISVADQQFRFYSGGSLIHYMRISSLGIFACYDNLTSRNIITPMIASTEYTIRIVFGDNATYHLDVTPIGGNVTRFPPIGEYTNYNGGTGFVSSFVINSLQTTVVDFTIDDIITSWNTLGPDILATTPVGKGRVLKIYDNNAGLNLDFQKTILETKAPNGRISFECWPVTGAGGTFLQFTLKEDANIRIQFYINLTTGVVYLYNNVPAWVSTGLTASLDAVNHFEVEWSNTDRNGDANPDARVILNGVYSPWIRAFSNWVTGINIFNILTGVANTGIEVYINDITLITTGLAFNSAITKPQISYPDGDFLDVRFLQRGREPVVEPYVRLVNASGNGTEQRLVSLNDTAVMDHRVDEVNVYIPTTQTNYRVLGAGGVNAQWTDGLIPNHWLPLALTHQIHAKYPRLFTHDTFYNRYQFCYSAMTSLITEYSRIIVANLNYENCAEMEFTPSVHPFIHPNNIAFYRDCENALPEKFSNSPQRMRKSVLVPQEFFADYAVDADIVAAAAAWTDGGAAAGASFTCVMDEGMKVGKYVRDAVLYTPIYTFQTPSPTIPGVYSISFDVKATVGEFKVRIMDAAGSRIYLWFRTANYALWNETGPVLIANNAWGASDEYPAYVNVKLVIVGIGDFYVIVNGITYDNAGAYYANSSNFTGPITKLQFYSTAANMFCIKNIAPNWKLYPDIDADDFIVHPQYLGHAKPVEIVSLEDKWGFRDYGKYTAISNAHPTRSWVSFFITAPYGVDEGIGEVILYDIAGNEMLYIQVNPMNNTDFSVHPKMMLYDSTSAGGALTAIDGTWNGWLPVTVEFDNDNRKGNIYFHGQLVAGNITLGAGALVGFGKVVFLSGLKTVAPVLGIWRQEDFQSYAEAAAPGAPWAIVAGGTTAFTARYLDGDSRGYLNDTDGAATLSAQLMFPIPSTAAPAAASPYAIKWSQQINTLTNNGYAARITAAAPANGDLRIQIRAGGAIWNYTAGAWANTGLFAPFPTLEHEITIQFTTNALYNIYVDGVLQNAAPLAVQVAFAAVITDLTFYTEANADTAQVYIDDIDVSWSDCVQTADIHHVHGSLLIDGITFGGYDNSNKDFSSQTKNLFMLPYRDYINPHHSTFHNNLNGLDQDIIPLPLYNAVPDASFNIASWTRGAYWDYYSLATAGMYGGVVRNWYAWKFPYVFGGRFDEPNKDIKSIARLYHDVATADKKTSGKWEFVMHGNARQVYNVKDDFTAYLDGADIHGLNGWTIFLSGGNTSILVNGYENKKVLHFIDNSGAAYCQATNTLVNERTKVCYVHLKMEIDSITDQFVIFLDDTAGNHTAAVRFETTGQIQTMQAGAYGNIVAYLANTEYDVTIKVDIVLGKYWVYINNIMYGGMVGYSLGNAVATGVKTIELLTDTGAMTYNVYLWDFSAYGEPGSIDVTLDYDKLYDSGLVEIPTPPMDICEKWQLQFVPASIGTKAIIQGDGISEDFQQYLTNVVPTTGWTIAGASATAWFKTLDVGGNIIGSFHDFDAAATLAASFVFPTPSTNPISLRTWVSADMTPITISGQNMWMYVRSAVAGTIYLGVSFTTGNEIRVTQGAGTILIGTWVSGVKYRVQIIVISSSLYDVIINDVLYDNAGAHYTPSSLFTVANVIGSLYFGAGVMAMTNTDVYIDNIAASWLRAPTTIANYDKAKALHKYTVEWDTGFIWTSIDDKLVDQRKYAGRVPFYLDKFKAHVCSGYGLHEIYAVMFGAQCDNEAAYEPNCLDLIPGGTMEQEGYTGILNTRNKGTYALLNAEDEWTLEKTNFWKTMMLDSGGLPVLGNFDDVQNDLVELEKKAVGHRSNVYNNANKV